MKGKEVTWVLNHKKGSLSLLYSNDTLMKKILSIILLAVFLFALDGKAQGKETLNYVISYKWGLIHKDAGDATFIRTPKGNGFELKVVGKTKPWADKIFHVRDTLISMVGKNNYLPTKYTRIAHEKGKYSRDEINFSRSGNVTKGTGKKIREKKAGAGITTKEINIQGTGQVYDILSVVYFIRNLDFANMKEKVPVTATIFSGDQVEKLTIYCKGKEKIKLKDKKERESWHIVFKFTTGGGKKSSDDINCWISDDSSHIPLLITGSLPVGQVRCTYVPK